mgnify:CR=1 FL=1
MTKPSSSFSGNVLKLVSGSVLAQGLGVLAAPIVARLYAPEAFGIASIIISISGILGVVSCLRYELAIMLPEADAEAANLLALCLCFVVATTALSVLVLFFCGKYIAQTINAPEMNKYLWFVPISVFFSGISLALSYWNSRTKHFGRLSIARITTSAATQMSKLGTGVAGYVSAGVLIMSGIAGQVVSTTLLGWLLWKNDGHLFKGDITKKRMIEGFKRHKNFPLFGTWSALLNSASRQLPTLLLAFYFSPEIVGFYALGRNVLSLPMTLVGGAVSQVFFQKASEANRQAGKLPQIVEDVFKRLCSLGLFPVLLLTLIGKDLFVVVFGERWAEAGVYMQILGIWIFFVFISSPISTLFSILEKQRCGLVFNIGLFSSRVLSLCVGGWLGDARFAVILFSSTGTIAYSILAFWLMSCAEIKPIQAIKILCKNTIMAAPILSMVAVCIFILDFSPRWVLLVALTGCFPYYILVLKRDRELQKPIMLWVKKAIE